MTGKAERLTKDGLRRLAENRRKMLAEYEELLRDVADSGVVLDDARLDYVEVQIHREVWETVTGLVGTKVKEAERPAEGPGGQ